MNESYFETKFRFCVFKAKHKEVRKLCAEAEGTRRFLVSVVCSRMIEESVVKKAGRNLVVLTSMNNY